MWGGGAQEGRESPPSPPVRALELDISNMVAVAGQGRMKLLHVTFWKRIFRGASAPLDSHTTSDTAQN